MTEMLDVVVAKPAALPPQEQDRIAQWLMQELPDEKLWDKRFSESEGSWAELADEARRDRAAGRATEMYHETL